ncbi:MAG TPA: response regulator transcription factor [Bryobacteraceae bacterium]|jgi:two-component system alkaline phosphatase synthesis response regulator PhoP
MNSRILLIEDEPGLVMTVSDLLAAEGYDVETASDGDSGFAKAASGNFDLVLLDVMLPRRSGYDVCRDLRQHGVDSAILMLTARTQVVDRVVGLKLGADDYLSKPFDPAELLARIEALLRRLRKGHEIGVRSFHFGDVEVDFDRAEVRKSGEPRNLAAKELQLLHYLVDRRGQVVPREELLRQVWEYSAEASSRTVDVHIAWLRQKLEDNPQRPRHIQTLRGKGYRFSA